jgi:hypothetical protein
MFRGERAAVLAALAAFLSGALSVSCGGGGGGGGPVVRPTPMPVAVDLCTTLGKGVQTAQCGAAAWAANTHYYVDELVTYGGSTYVCKQEHSSDFGLEPPKARGKWGNIGPQSTPQLSASVDAAIAKLVQDNPGIFNKSHEGNPGSGDYEILDFKTYFAGVTANLNAAGLCAQSDIFNDHRIKVKNSAGFSEDYNISTPDLGSGSFIQSGVDAFDRTCMPAAFPLDRNPDVPPPDQGCFQPYPPQINHFGEKVELRGDGTHTLDSTPQITDNPDYCRSIRYTDNRSFCPLRPEGTAERVPCEGWRVGLAQDTGRLGPTWTRDGKPCTGPDSGCDNEPHNQYRLVVYYDSGNTHTYTACTDIGFCGSLDLAY